MTSAGANKGTPARRRGSVRRTTSHVVSRPLGLDGPAVLHAAGRDLRTDASGEARWLATAGLTAEVDYLGGTLLALALEPREPRLDPLVGGGFFAGFRAAVLRALPGEAGSHSLRYQLLDDLPVAVMGNGRALRAEGRPVTRQTERRPPIDLCAGYARDGTAIAGFTDLGPPLTPGPPAGELERADDPLAWHEMEPLTPHATCRVRRLDVWSEGGVARADVYFRDSHCDRDGRHRVVHEWAIAAEIDPLARSIATIAAEPGPLPYSECPGSAASAQRLVGLPIDGLRRHIREDFLGPSICSHLNDSLRAMEDLGALLDLV